MVRARVVLTTLFAFAACVPPDGAGPLGSVAFTVGATKATTVGLRPETLDGWDLRFTRLLVSFRTMTLGRIGEPEACSYRGRGERSNLVFDPRYSIVQTFNGIAPSDCRDVGIVFAPPGDETELGPGVTEADLVELASGAPAHLLVEAEARRPERTFRVALRFDTARSAREFGGCRDALRRGVQIAAEHRVLLSVRLAAEGLFRVGVLETAPYNLGPFVDADAAFDGDGVATMAEIDAYPLQRVRDSHSNDYVRPDGSTLGSFGDYVRDQLRFSIAYGEGGLCVGNEPKEE